MTYDVFISYSQTGDSLLSERVQDGLARFAKPWWRRRALNVFRDQTGLTANPGLWSSIAAAIDDSRFFLYLASPEAAASQWVAREVAQWRAEHGSHNLLVVLTDGEIVWDDRANEFDWPASTALTTSLAGCFTEPPRYVDMRWARAEARIDLAHARFREQIVELAAPVRGMAKADLVGADVRQYRRTLRQVFAAGIAFVLLLLASVTIIAFTIIAANDKIGSANRKVNAANAKVKVANGRVVDANAKVEVANGKVEVANGKVDVANGKVDVANGKVDVANGEVKVANGNVEVANGRLGGLRDVAEDLRKANVVASFVADSQRALGAGLTDRALLLAVQAAKFASRSGGLISDADAKPALVAALQANPRLVGWLQGLDGPIVDVAVATDSRRAAAVTSDGRVAVWSLPDRNRLFTFLSPGRPLVPFTPTPGTLNEFAVRFLGPSTLVVASHERLDAYRAAPNGESWLHLWTWHPRNRRTWIDSITAAPNQVLIASRRFDGDGLIGRSYYDLLDANGQRTVHAESKVGFWRIAFSPSGYLVAGVVQAHFTDSDRQPCHDGYEVVFLSPTVKPVDFCPAPAPSSGTGMTFTGLGVSDLRFSSDGREIAVLLFGYGAPVYRFEVATGDPIAVEPGDLGWPSLVPGKPIGLSPSLDAIVQRDPDNPNFLEVSHIGAQTLTRDLAAPVTEGGIIQLDPYGPPAFTTDGLFLTPGGDGAVPIFELPDVPNSHFASTRASRGQTTCWVKDDCGVNVALSPDGRTLASIFSPNGGDWTLQLTTLDGSRAARSVSLARRPGMSGDSGTGRQTLTFNDAGDEIAVGYIDGTVGVFDAVRAAPIVMVKPWYHCKYEFDFCGPNLLFSGSFDHGRLSDLDGGEVTTWDLQSGRVIARPPVSFAGAQLAVGLLGRNTSGSRIVVETGGLNIDSPRTVHVLDVTASGWTQPSRFAVGGFPGDGAVSPDGTQLVTVDRTHVSLYDLDRGAIVWQIAGDDAAVWFGPDGSLYTATLGTGEIRVRSTRFGGIEYVLDSTSPHPNPIDAQTGTVRSALVFTGSHLVTAVESVWAPEVIVTTDWPLATSELVTAACREAGRNLVQAEWRQYVDPYEATCPEYPAGQ